MDLLFLGRGSAFNTIEGNTSAYFIDKNELFLIDCGESVFGELKERNILNDVSCVNILITHTHSDHVGSIGSLIMYCYYAIKKNVNIIISRDSLYKDDIVDLIRIFGCTTDMYNIVYEEECSDYSLFNSVKYIKTNHVPQISSYGILFDTSDGVVYYSGDIGDLDSVSDLISSGVLISKIYVDTTSKESSGCHVFIGDLNKVIPSDLRSKVYCMHINNDKCIHMAMEYGFNVVCQ